MNGVSVGIKSGFVNRFSQSGVSVNGGVNIVNSSFEGKGQSHLGDEVGGVFPDDVSAENFAVFFAEEEFDEAFGLAAGLGLAEGLVWEPADFVFDAFFLESPFGFSDGGNFRIAIGATGELLDAFHGVAFHEHAVDTLDRFEAGGVGEPRRPGDIADGGGPLKWRSRNAR